MTYMIAPSFLTFPLIMEYDIFWIPLGREGTSLFLDYHIHSTFSLDSQMTLQQICAQSLLVGLDEIAITDHYDFDCDYVSTFDHNQYLAALTRLQAEYAGKLQIKKGMELGLQPHQLAECAEKVHDDFDFVIASVHSAQKKDLYAGDFFQGYTQMESYRAYLQEVLDCIRGFDRFSVVGHLDLVRRYGDFTQVPDLMEDADCQDLFRDILLTLIHNGKGIEVNTSGYYIGSGADPLPTRSVLRLYRELGGEIITTGSDSHTPTQLGYKFTETYAMLRDLGFRYVTGFDAMQPVQHPLG